MIWIAIWPTNPLRTLGSFLILIVSRSILLLASWYFRRALPVVALLFLYLDRTLNIFNTGDFLSFFFVGSLSYCPCESQSSTFVHDMEHTLDELGVFFLYL